MMCMQPQPALHVNDECLNSHVGEYGNWKLIAAAVVSSEFCGTWIGKIPPINAGTNLSFRTGTLPDGYLFRFFYFILFFVGVFSFIDGKSTLPRGF